MTTDLTPPPRAAIVRRIERLLAGLQRARRKPNRREAYHLRVALEELEAGRLAEAETASLCAERAAPLPAHIASLLSTNEPVALEALLEHLARITKAG